MARIRTIQPDFPRSPSMGRVSREARLLFVLLWTIVDDEGRCHAAPDDLAQVLYPADFDAHMYLLDWLDQLENENCIERYEVDDVDYLRIVRWKRHQRIYHPTPSYLPPPPSEELDDSEIREISGKLNGRGRKVLRDQALAARSDTFPENCDFRPDGSPEKDEAPVVVTQQRLLRYLEDIRASAMAEGEHTPALRSIAMQAQIGLKPGKLADRNKDTDTPSSKSPGELLP